MTPDAALRAALNSTGRRPCLTTKLKVKGLATVYLHVEYDHGRPVKFRISSPGKYFDTHIEQLLDAVAAAATEALK